MVMFNSYIIILKYQRVVCMWTLKYVQVKYPDATDESQTPQPSVSTVVLSLVFWFWGQNWVAILQWFIIDSQHGSCLHFLCTKHRETL